MSTVDISSLLCIILLGIPGGTMAKHCGKQYNYLRSVGTHYQDKCFSVRRWMAALRARVGWRPSREPKGHALYSVQTTNLRVNAPNRPGTLIRVHVQVQRVPGRLSLKALIWQLITWIKLFFSGDESFGCGCL